jgi:hypothetical protein
MTIGIRPAMLVALIVLVGGLAAFVLRASRPSAGQSSTYRAQRLPGTDHPDLSGLWQALTSANWDIEPHGVQESPFVRLLGVWAAKPAGEGIVESDEIPYKPEALARKKANFERRLKVDPHRVHEMGDPEAKCYMPGVPRATYMPYPFQIIQNTNKIVVAYAFNSASRTISLASHPEAPVDSWMGWSNGRWEGDTLVVDVTGLNGLSWLDRAGNFMSENARVVERYTPASPNHLMYEATIEDSTVFTRPWKISLPLYRRLERNAQFFEFKCVDLAEEYLYGSLVDPRGN